MATDDRKRGRTDADAASDARDDLARMFEDFKRETDTTLQRHAERTQTLVQAAVEKIDASYNNKFVEIEQDANELRKRQDALTNSHAELRTQIEALSAQVAAFPTPAAAHAGAAAPHTPSARSSQASTAATTRDARDADAVDPTILRLNCPLPVPRVAVAKFLGEWLVEEVKLKEEHFQLIGKDIDRHWIVRMGGELAEAMHRVDRAVKSLRADDGSWRDKHIPDHNGAATRLYIGRDKARTQIAKEKATRILLSTLREKHGGLALQAIKSTSTITINWKPLARIDFDDQGLPRPLWNGAVADEYRIRRDDINNEFRDNLGKDGSLAGMARVAWSV